MAPPGPSKPLGSNQDMTRTVEPKTMVHPMREELGATSNMYEVLAQTEPLTYLEVLVAFKKASTFSSPQIYILEEIGLLPNEEGKVSEYLEENDQRHDQA
jgi:hypothetical protein